MTTTHQGRTLATALAISAATLLGALSPGAAHADTTTNTSPIFARSGYDYAPTVIDTSAVRQIWWCGYNEDSNSDGILYRWFDKSTLTWSPIVTVLTPGSSGAWDDTHVCDPSVVMGEFVDPNHPEIDYKYAMYYTGVSDPAGVSGPLYDNKVGVVFSTDGQTWDRIRTTPVIVATNPVVAASSYGAGTPSAYNDDPNGADVRVFYFDTTSSPILSNYTQTSTDGMTFGGAAQVSLDGLALDGGTSPTMRESDYARDPSDGSWYAAIPTNEGYRVPADHAGFQFVIARTTDLVNGTWQQLGYVNSDQTLKAVNHNPGLVRSPFGEIVDPENVEVLYGSGPDFADDWELYSATINVGVNEPLERYYDAVSGQHRVTTGQVPAGFSPVVTLGYVAPGFQTGTVPLNSCDAGAMQFLSLDTSAGASPSPGTLGCETQNTLGVTGYVEHPSTSGTIGTHMIYRCATFNSVFASIDPACEGQTVQGPLGYVRDTQ